MVGLAVPILAVTGRLELWHLVISGAVFGALGSVFGPAYSAILPQILPKELLPGGNALGTSTRMLLTELAGPALGGLVIAVAGAPAGFLLDAATFLVSAAFLLPVRVGPPIGRERKSAIAEIREGLGYVRARRWLWV